MLWGGNNKLCPRSSSSWSVLGWSHIPIMPPGGQPGQGQWTLVPTEAGLCHCSAVKVRFSTLIQLLNCPYHVSLTHYQAVTPSSCNFRCSLLAVPHLALSSVCVHVAFSAWDTESGLQPTATHDSLTEEKGETGKKSVTPVRQKLPLYTGAWWGSGEGRGIPAVLQKDHILKVGFKARCGGLHL